MVQKIDQEGEEPMSPHPVLSDSCILRVFHLTRSSMFHARTFSVRKRIVAPFSFA
jgi:hypothetical protein